MPYRCQRCQRLWDDAGAHDNDYTCTLRCQGKLVWESEDAGDKPPAAIETFCTTLPSFLAIPFRSYFATHDPVHRLHRLCDAVEVLTRFLTIVGIAELRRQSDAPLPSDLEREFQPRIERPTFGQWRDLLIAVCGHVPTADPLVDRELWNGTRKVLLPALSGGLTDLDAQNLIDLRNLLVHGGATAQLWARDQLQVCEPWLEQLVLQLAPLQHCEICQIRPDGAQRLTFLAGDQEEVYPLPANVPVAALQQHVVLLSGERYLDLWPLCDFGRANTNSPSRRKVSQRAGPLIYFRCERDRLLYAALGNDLPFADRVDERTAFVNLFRLNERATVSDVVISDFTAELRCDAAALCGREDETQQAKQVLKETQSGVLWISGPGGIGKSFLMARLATDLSNAPKSTCCIAWRFKQGDLARCNRQAFLHYAVTCLLRWPPLGIAQGVAAHHPDTLLEQFTQLLTQVGALTPTGRNPRAPRVLLMLDGLDEIARLDPEFPTLPFKLPETNVVWVCSGRPEGDLPHLFRSEVATPVFPDGVPPMSDNDIRGMLLSIIGELKYDVLKHDREVIDARGGKRIVNAVVETLVERAAGLPLYVHFVIADLLSTEYTVDQFAQFPPSLEAYFEELLKRLAMGELQILLTPMLVTLCLAKAPLDEATLHTLLVQRKLILASENSLATVRRAREALQSMIRPAEIPGTATVGYEPYHTRFRDYIQQRADLADQRQLTQAMFAELLDRWPNLPSNDAARRYACRLGVQHLIESKHWSILAKRLTDIDFLQASVDAGGTYDLSSAYQALAATRQHPEATPWQVFIDHESHVLAQAPELLVQQAANQPNHSPLCEAAEAYLVRTNDKRPRVQWLNKPAASAPSRLIRTLAGHTAAITHLSVALDGERLLSGDNAGTLRVWDLRTGEALASQTLERCQIHTIVADEQGWRVVVTTFVPHPGLTTIEVLATPVATEVWRFPWDASGPHAGQLLAKYPETHHRVATLGVLPDRQHFVSRQDAEIFVWNGQNRAEKARFRDHKYMHHPHVAIGEQMIASSDDPQQILLWDSQTGERRDTLSVSDRPLLNMLFLDRDRYLLLLKFDSMSSGDMVLVEREPANQRRLQHGPELAYARSLALAPDGRRLAIGNTTIGGSTGKVLVQTVQLKADPPIRPEFELAGHLGAVEVLAFTPDGQRLISGSNDKTIKVWDLVSELKVEQPTWSTAINQTVKNAWRDLGRGASGYVEAKGVCAVSPEGFTVQYELSRDGFGLELHELCRDGLANWRCSAATGPVEFTVITRLAVSHQLHLWAIGDHRGHVTIWKSPINNTARHALPPAVGYYLPTDTSSAIVRLPKLEHGVIGLLLTEDGMRGLALGDDDNAPLAWELERGVMAQGALHQHLQSWNLITPLTERAFWRAHRVWKLAGHAAEVHCIALAPDGRTAVTGSRDHTLKVWDFASGSERFTLPGRGSPVTCVLISPDGRCVVSATKHGEIQIWHGMTGALQHAWPAHHAEIGRLAWCGAERIVSGGNDGWLIVWELRGKEVARFPISGQLNGLGVDPEGRIVALDHADNFFVLNVAEDQ